MERESEAEDAGAEVKVFVEFIEMRDAQSARDSLHGRFFGGKQLRVDIYDPALFHANDLTR